jgi:dihydrodipicolinate synthase/N-acetylneuraminate lyase
VKNPPPVRPGRRIHGIAALLLPFDSTGKPDLGAFSTLVTRGADAGLEVAVNMDTGFGPELTPRERLDVLRLTRETLGPHASFVAGAMPFGHDGDVEHAYRTEIDAIVAAGAVPVVFPSEATASLEGAELAGFVERVTSDAPSAIAFELSPVFAPFGKLFGPDTAKRLMAIPNIIGLKHSSLDRVREWELLELRDAERPDFRIYTGNDLAIDMVCYGSDYLLGLATFDVRAFAIRDARWANCDERFHALNDALQAVGTVAFRDPVPAYKHSAALYLKLTGQLDDPRPHPKAELRPGWESEILRPLADRVALAERD